MSERAHRVRITGHVQGVGFRWYAREAARRHNLRGWVRNLDDGSVEVICAGADAGVRDFLAALRRGPSGAGVRGFDVTDMRPADVAAGPFAIRRQ